MRRPVVIVVASVLMGAAACSSKQPAATVGETTAVADLPATPPTALATGTATIVDAAAMTARFLDAAFMGNPLNWRVRDYLAWLAGRPGSRSYDVAAQQTAGTIWMVTVTLTGDQNQQAVARCAVDAAAGFPSESLWLACPQLIQLWTALAPATFDSLDEARPFIVPAPVFFPRSPVDSYQLTRITFPQGTQEVALSPFTFTAVFMDGSGAEVRLMQQPGGFGGVPFLGWQQCAAGTWSVTAHCLSWASMGSYFVLASDAASLDTLHAFEHAIDPRR